MINVQNKSSYEHPELNTLLSIFEKAFNRSLNKASVVRTYGERSDILKVGSDWRQYSGALQWGKEAGALQDNGDAGSPIVIASPKSQIRRQGLRNCHIEMPTYWIPVWKIPFPQESYTKQRNPDS